MGSIILRNIYIAVIAKAINVAASIVSTATNIVDIGYKSINIDDGSIYSI